MKLLIIDDESEQLRSLRVGLKAKGYEVITALSVPEAMDWLQDKAHEVDLVISDYMMPGMDGLTLLTEMGKLGRSIPIILMTAYSEKKLVIKALRLGCDGFIEKPFTLEEMLGEIDRVEELMRQRTEDLVNSDLLPQHCHQINNPLGVILGNAQLCELEADRPEDVKSRLGKIINATEKIKAINGDILRQGRRPAFKKVEIEDLLENCLAMYEGQIKQSEIAVARDFTAPVRPVWGDHLSLEQVFTNLIVNAIQAMEGRPGEVLHVGTAFHEATSTLAVVIRDTGCGIPQERQGRIFDPYFTTKKQGTGLGLHVVKAIVKAHHGKVEIISEVGRGTTFTVFLPTEQRRAADQGG